MNGPPEFSTLFSNAASCNRAYRAESVWCPGCEWQCHKTVVVRTVGERTPSAAFITCDEEPDHGRISVPLRSLVQYAATLSGVSGFLPARWNLGRHDHRPPGRHSSWGPSRAGTGLVRSLLSLDARAADAAGGPTTGERGPRPALGRRRPIDRQGPYSASRQSQGGGIAVARVTARRIEPCGVSGRADARARHEAIFREAKRRRRGATEDSWTAIATAIAATDLAKAEQGRRLSAATVRRIVTKRRR